MRNKAIDKKAMFQPIRGAAEITGLSTKHIREGCRRGEIPHIRVGGDYRVNMPLWLDQLNDASKGV